MTISRPRAITVPPAGSALLLPVALKRRRTELTGLSKRQVTLMLTAGALLAAHFGTWIPSLSFTTVASAVALAATQPVWVTLIARIRGDSVPARAWLGIGMAVAGTATVSGLDIALSREALVGDLLALAGGIFGAGYLTVGGEVRRRVTTTGYTAVCYAVAAAALLGICLFSGQQLIGYAPATWLMIAGVAAGPQLLGHSLFNRALHTTSPTIVSLAMLLVTPGATLIAWGWLGHIPPLTTVPALILLLGGAAVVVTSPGKRYW